MSDVETSWGRIMAWCRAHAPATAAAVTPSSGDAEITAAEGEFGVRFPEDLRDFFRYVGGITDSSGSVLPPYYSPLSLTESLREWRGIRETRGDIDDLPPAELVAGSLTESWLRSFVPIGEDGCGNSLFVDLRPGDERGCIADFDKVEGFACRPYWSSVTAMLTEIVAGLENNHAVVGCRWGIDVERVHGE